MRLDGTINIRRFRLFFEIDATAIISFAFLIREFLQEEKGEIHTSEFQSGSLFRSIHLPKKIDADKVKAEIKNGLLTITAPIAEEAKSRKVSIQAA